MNRGMAQQYQQLNIHLEHEHDGVKQQSMQFTKNSTKELKAVPVAYKTVAPLCNEA